ncbi:colicin-D, partial [Salmonella enterica]|nr:colicin-D [Salmonella enterica]
AAIGRGIAALTASTAGPMVAAASTIFFSPPAGGGSDKVPGRDLDALFALNAQLLTGQNEKIEPGVNSVNLPVRAQLVNSNGQMAMQLLKTGEGLPAAVPVLNAVRDAATGLDRITVPAVAGAPERIILVNPALPPTAPSDTASPPPSVPVTPVHTGTEIKPVETITVTTTPAADIGGLQDFIYWRPYAAGTGVEPVYVMLSDPLDSGRFTRKQLDKRYKHAGDFGVNEPKKNSETLSKFRAAIEAHLTDKDTVEKGTYRREKGSKVYFNPKSMNVVILKANGEWLSGWKINPATENGRIYLETGDL